MKWRSFLIGLTAIVLVLLSAAAAGAVWITSHSPVAQLQPAEPSDTAAQFVSQQSPLVLSLRVNPDRLEAADLLSVPVNLRSQRRAEWAELRQTLLADLPFNYQRDIQPWLGDQAWLAVTTPDVDRDSRNGAQVGYLFVFTPRDAALASQTLERFWQRHARAKDRITDTYAGVPITYKQTEAALTPASAVVSDRLVLIANSPKVLRDAINTVQIAQSLDQSNAYQQAIEQLPNDALGFAFVNLPQLSTWLTDRSASSGPYIYDRLLLTLDSRQSDIKQSDVNTLLLSPSANLTPTKPTLSTLVKALRFIPAASSIVAAGSNVEQAWAGLQTGLAGYENLAELLRQSIAPLQQASLPEVLSWMTGDYAIARLPRGASADWLLVTQHTPDTEAGLAKLNAIAREQGTAIGTLALETPIGTQTISAWTKLSTHSSKAQGKSSVSLDAQVQGVHTTVEDYEIFATSLEAIDQALQAADNSWLNSDKFQAAIASLKTPNQGYFYLDGATLQQVLNRTPFADRNFPMNSLLKSVRSLIITSYGTEKIGQRGAVHIEK